MQHDAPNYVERVSRLSGDRSDEPFTIVWLVGLLHMEFSMMLKSCLISSMDAVAFHWVF